MSPDLAPPAIGIAPIIGPPIRDAPAVPCTALGPLPAPFADAAPVPIPARGAAPDEPDDPEVPPAVDAAPPEPAANGEDPRDEPKPLEPEMAPDPPPAMPKRPERGAEEAPLEARATVPGELPVTLREPPTSFRAAPAPAPGDEAVAPDRPNPGLGAFPLAWRAVPDAVPPTPLGMTPDAATPGADAFAVLGEPAPAGVLAPPAGAEPPDAPPPTLPPLEARVVCASTPEPPAAAIPPAGGGTSRFHRDTGGTSVIPAPPALPTRCAGVKLSSERFALSRLGL